MATEERGEGPQDEIAEYKKTLKELAAKPVEERVTLMTDEALISTAMGGTLNQMTRIALLKQQRKEILTQRVVEQAALERIDQQLSSLGELDEATTDRSRVQVQSMGEVDPQPPAPPILDRIADKGGTVIFGRGGTGKGSYVSWLVLQLIRRAHWDCIVILDFEHRPYEWRPRFDALGATDEELNKIIFVTPRSSAPIWDQLEDIQAAIRDKIGDQIPDLVITDSAARACVRDISGGDTSLPTRYYSAMDDLCQRHLTIAHINRDNRSQQASGSQRWHDDARLTWSLEEKGDSRLLTCRKHNGGPKPPRQMITPLGWTKPAAGQLAYITGFKEDAATQKIAELISEILDAPMTFSEMADALNNLNDDEDADDYKANSIKKAIQRDPGMFRRSVDEPGSERYPKYERVPPAPTKAEEARASNKGKAKA